MLDLGNQFHTRLLSAFFQLLRQRKAPSSIFFYYYENQAHFYLPAPTLYSLPLLSTLSVVRVKLSPACLPFTSKLLERLIHIFRTHFLNISQFLHTWQSRFCPLLDWSGSSEIHPDPVIHHILWPSSSCLSLQYVPLHFCWQPLLPLAIWYSHGAVNAAASQILSLDSCSNLLTAVFSYPLSPPLHCCLFVI